MSSPMGQLVGYARTSTSDQKAGLGAQIRDLEALGCNRIFSEEVSSVDTMRPQLEHALDYIREGDTFVVTKLDRLARSVADMVKIRDRLQRKGVALRILQMGGEQVDTSTSTGSLLLNLLGSIAEFERELMLERQREGIAKAKAEGRYKGRAPVPEAKATEVLRLRSEGLTAEAIVKATGVGRTSVFKILKDAKAAVGA